MKILERIKQQKEIEIAEAYRRTDLAKVREEALAQPPCRGFAKAIRGRRDASEPRRPGRSPRTVSVIAEVKKASPSVGLIREDFDPVAIAGSYEAGGAAAISCLTDEKFFQGSLDYLRAIRRAVALPILRKEFIMDPMQVWEARQAGADAILLIAGFAPWDRLATLRDAAHEAGLDVLLEIHAADELEDALALGPDVLGVNNRNLRTENFQTNLATTFDLAGRVPAKMTFISESGIRTREDVERLAEAGVDGILVGEHLMREDNPGWAIAEKLGITGIE